MATFPLGADLSCKTKFEIAVQRSELGDIVVPTYNRLKKRISIYFPINCNTKKLIQPNNLVDFIEILDSSVTPKFRRGLISGKSFSPQSTGYHPLVIHRLFSLIEKKYEKTLSQLCGGQSYCDEIIVKKWRDYYLKFDTDEFDKLNPDDFDPDT